MRRLKVFLIIFAILTVSYLVLAFSPVDKPKYCGGFDSSHAHVKVAGIITEVYHPIAKLKSDNRVYTMRLGPWWYWRSKKWQLKVGESVEVAGYLQGDLLFPVVIKTPDKIMKLRDKDGIPLWRGMHRHFDTHH